MTEKKIFAYKLFFQLNISDFNLFFLKIATPLPEKNHPTLCQQPPSKSRGPVKPHPLLENLVGGSTPLPPPPPAERGREVAHYGLSAEFLLHFCCISDTYSAPKTF